jgi:hypothetical protein
MIVHPSDKKEAGLGLIRSPCLGLSLLGRLLRGIAAIVRQTGN